MIFVRPLAGLCNRLRVINSAVKLSQDLNTRLVVFWQTDPEMNCSYRSLFQVPEQFKVVDCHFKDVSQRALFHRHNFFVSHEYHADSIRPFAISTCSEFYGKENVGGYEDWFAPQSNIIKAVDDIISSHSSQLIGLHVRRTDNKISIEKSPLFLFEQKIDFELKHNPNAVFFLASDDESVKRRLVGLYGSAVFTRNVASRNDKNGVSDALIDLVLLSKCKKIYGSYFSSFSEEAAKIGNVDFESLHV